ncbi:MAG: ATP-binding protein [Adlercreutzia sp.]|nr:ATP-binding protein [Adlercreutzia sp.]
MKNGALVERPRYQAVLESLKDTPSIKVLSGVRRCGKSTLLLMFAHQLGAHGVPDQNLLYRKMDSFDVPLEPSATWLEDVIREALEKRDADWPLYVFLDEVQEVRGWEKVVRRLHTASVADIYLTGSNAFLLSSDLATYLSGRYVEVPVYPLSFREYIGFSQASGEATQQDELFARYTRFGGMPGLFKGTGFDTESVARELTAVHDTVILNDVAKRFELRDIDLLEKLVRYVYSTSGNLFSSRKVAGALTSAGRKTNPPTVDTYLNALERAFLLYPCEQEGVGGKQVLQPQRKWYAPDTGLRNREIGFAVRDIGYQLESIVFLELKRRGYTVNVGDGRTGEIDFVARRADERLYLQVSDSVREERTLERELSSLRAVTDAFPKLVLTRDALLWGTTEDGIQIRGLTEWLLDD